MEELKAKWERVVEVATARFSPGDPLDVDSLVFIVGLQEVNQPHQKWSKEAKLDLMHVGICRLLEPLGSYRLGGRDADGWPQYALVEALPHLKAGQQSLLMKEALVGYFEENGWID